MAKLTKEEIRNHSAACDLLKKDVLNDEEKIFVLENWHEGATHTNSAAGAFFTPTSLARDFAIDAGGGRRVIDLCAGIGSLGFWLKLDERADHITCIEINPDYIEVGRKILPHATWIQADVFNLPELGYFDLAVSNPPFGKTARRGQQSQRYTGSTFEFHVIDIASEIADRGAFIIPQGSAPFQYSGQHGIRFEIGSSYKKFTESTGIVLEPGCGIDTGLHLNDWKGVKPLCEVVTAEFSEVQEARQIAAESSRLNTTRDLFDLFGIAA